MKNLRAITPSSYIIAACALTGIVSFSAVTSQAGQMKFLPSGNSTASAQVESVDNQDLLAAVPIPSSELPPALEKNTVFRAIASGGFFGQTVETRLLNNGQVIQQYIRINGNSTPTEIARISRQDVKGFKKFLNKDVDFSQFDQLSYPAPIGAADYISVTLSSNAGTTRYADIGSNQLPEALQQVIQNWETIVSSLPILK
ncbi:MAG: hypothetical protein F6K44_23010, partial [Moorea sp. SIO3E2]|nr:hypothetical protein [Moorena sp. SIO3E2]